MADSHWTDEQLRASVEAYVDMLDKSASNVPYVKKHYYQVLADKFGRSNKAYEYRMQNISYVYSLLGRRWVKGLKPARNVGATNLAKLQKLIADVEQQSFAQQTEFDVEVNRLKEKRYFEPPKGQRMVQSQSASVTQHKRDPNVKAWVLQNAKGICESCCEPSPFESYSGEPFLEVHHLRRLADKGSDTVTNAVALCPNCHRELHYGRHQETKLQAMYARIERLIAE
ncbi:HNH endonuclease [Aliamphritea hakodatensis]|uniref:HNH endonuclease n=1 Tax=Aliamphritea hakodatensis TaxID=2895352 RepID=UPI0022FD48F8|nr:HNH endonuclease signature motif containing protein [Aliamphritea hakodatensis]